MVNENDEEKEAINLGREDNEIQKAESECSQATEILLRSRTGWIFAEVCIYLTPSPWMRHKIIF